MARRTQSALVIAALCGATVLIADVLVPRSGHGIPLAYINAGILVLASAALAELVISSHHAHERLEALLALKTVSLTEIHHRVKNNLQIVSPCSSFNPTNLLILVFAMFSPNVATASTPWLVFTKNSITSMGNHTVPELKAAIDIALHKHNTEITMRRALSSRLPVEMAPQSTGTAQPRKQIAREARPKLCGGCRLVEAVGIAPTQRAFHQ